jgi:epoxyqueuosine reductase
VRKGVGVRVLLHACCGPCLLEPYDALALEHEVRVVYANPNIQPAEEYARRRDTLLEYAGPAGIEVDELPYRPDLWLSAVAGTEGDREARCRACYRLRLSMAAARAAESGYDAVATTLTVSPYQDHEALADEAKKACAEAGVAFLETDFRDRFSEAQRRARELGMYRQNFCGCVYSAAEADADRARRREERKRSG